MRAKATFRIFLLLIITSAILFTGCNVEDTSNHSINIGPNLTTEKAPVMWEVKSKKIDDETYRVYMICYLFEGWHVYSQELESDDGPIPTTFTYELPGGFEKLGGTKEGKPEVHYDPNFMMDLSYFDGIPIFEQDIITTSAPQEIIVGIDFMVCNDEMCHPPNLIEFKVDLYSGIGTKMGYEDEDSRGISSILPILNKIDLDNPEGDCAENKLKSINSLWMVFLFGLIGGLIALLTPCVFPMIPLTVSFFTKSGENKSSGTRKAIIYGIFIFLIYAIISVPFHFGTDPETLNDIATSATLNLIFFAVFVVFAISFFGFFEITLPSGLLNKADNASNVGGIIGIFFMAVTLALVSFSCTGPILGTVLGNVMADGAWPITAAMSGFGIGLGLPFAIFAAFPSMLINMPKSGGWLNSVKVVLGFLELALAIKFLSNADLVYQWGLIKRETFFLIWTLIGIGLTLYMLGLIRFPHDSKIKKLSKFRLGFTAIVISFTVYIAPGVIENPPWGHNLLAGFPPPVFYSWYEKDSFHAEFDDFDLALAHAKEVNKPLLIDFTGWACVNCRQMEETVWTVDEIKKIIEDEFVLVSLYVDDKVELPRTQQGVFEFDNNGESHKMKIVTKGDKWAKFQTHYFHNNSQPYYVMLSQDGYLLGNPVGYTPDVDKYLEYLKCGVRANQKLNLKPKDTTNNF